MIKSRLLLLVFSLFCYSSLYAESITHSHNGRTHQHQLPAEGIHHKHNNVYRKYIKKKFSREKIYQCISIVEEWTSSIVAQDYNSLIKISKHYLSFCKGRDKPIVFASYASGVASGYNKLGKYKQALNAANNCINTIYFGSPDCHLDKTVALKGLGRRLEAKKSWSKTKRLTIHELKKDKENLKRSKDNFERKVFLANIYKYNAFLKLLDTL